MGIFLGYTKLRFCENIFWLSEKNRLRLKVLNLQDAIDQDKKMGRAQRKMDESRKRIEAGLRNAENKVREITTVDDISRISS
jgi:hypothetical protein